jgi:hypothetical protein
MAAATSGSAGGFLALTGVPALRSMHLRVVVSNLARADEITGDWPHQHVTFFDLPQGFLVVRGLRRPEIHIISFWRE